ncbi:polysaccharide deacetylase family protein [Micromonospora sp. WMMC241]|uniref:polysaccharide deacetylase family protein n=1 Tax=Micromonospora sp. WMMC241 TaxID=3015159 RepID=UPI0022B65F62|nr:polysaccharide deacetylase family protein [Micromonospora sp. WMMC241]MCZ7439391.1 polysaccharide deacetylase family protein [Micromonospora sp. WMMC241]
MTPFPAGPTAAPTRSARRPLVVAATAALLTAVTSGLVVTAAPSMAAACTGYVALTFDDGPTPGNTTTLINTLRAAGVRATFFNVGQNVQANPALARAQRDAGMWVGNHSWTHPHMTQLSQAQMTSEISQTQQAIQQATGEAPKLFRPPYLESNATLRAVEAQFGLTEINADVDSQDWNNASTDQIVQNASRLQAGQSILMHDWPANTIAAIPRIVSNLTSRGLCAGMISPATGRAVAPDGGTPTTPPPTTAPPTTAPPTTPPPTTPPPTTPPPDPSGACTASYRLVSSWTGGFQGEVTVSSTRAVTGWTVRMTLAGGQSIANVWNGVVTGTTGAVSVRNAAYNGTLNAGGSTTFGFLANGSSSPAPSGITCSTS